MGFLLLKFKTVILLYIKNILKSIFVYLYKDIYTLALIIDIVIFMVQ